MEKQKHVYRDSGDSVVGGAFFGGTGAILAYLSTLPQSTGWKTIDDALAVFDTGMAVWFFRDAYRARKLLREEQSE